eukprot:4974332-Karenia_brevis.AAC.1
MAQSSTNRSGKRKAPASDDDGDALEILGGNDGNDSDGDDPRIVTTQLHDNFVDALGLPKSGTVLKSVRPGEDGIPCDKWWSKVWQLK